MPKPLTAAGLSALKRPAQGQVEHADGGCSGLRLRLSQGGTATWVLGMRDRAGRAKRFPLGQYPTLGLAEARKQANLLRHKVRHEGHDPIAEARRVRLQARDAVAGKGTLAALIDAYGPTAAAGKRSWPEARRRVRSVFATLLSTPVELVTSTDLQLAVDGHKSRSSAGAAVRYLRPILKWGTRRSLVADGLATRLEQPAGAARRRDRVLDAAELRALLLAVDDSGYGRCLRWLLWTVCRLNEATQARWRDVADGLWRIPATKGGREHVVPLPRQATRFLDTLGRGAPDDLLFPNGRGGVLANWDEWTKRLHEQSQTSGWHRHDLRRTAATMLGELGVAPHVIEIVLGHADPHTRLAGVYNRSRYRPEHAKALRLLADRLDGVLKGSSATVVRLAR